LHLFGILVPRIILRCIFLLNELIFKNQLKDISFLSEAYLDFLHRVLHQFNILCEAVRAVGNEYFLNAASFTLILALQDLICIFLCKSRREVIFMEMQNFS